MCNELDVLDSFQQSQVCEIPFAELDIHTFPQLITLVFPSDSMLLIAVFRPCQLVEFLV